VITSATSFQNTWTRAKYVVNAEDDDIVCVFNEQTKKKNSPTESGTAVSLLLPVSQFFNPVPYSLLLNSQVQDSPLFSPWPMMK
jgi:hypothetical protein